MTNWLSKHSTELRELYESRKEQEDDLEFYISFNKGKVKERTARRKIREIQEKISKFINKIVR